LPPDAGQTKNFPRAAPDIQATPSQRLERSINVRTPYQVLRMSGKPFLFYTLFCQNCKETVKPCLPEQVSPRGSDESEDYGNGSKQGSFFAHCRLSLIEPDIFGQYTIIRLGNATGAGQTHRRDKAKSSPADLLASHPAFRRFQIMIPEIKKRASFDAPFL